MAENILTMENIVKTYKMGDEQQTVLKLGNSIMQRCKRILLDGEFKRCAVANEEVLRLLCQLPDPPALPQKQRNQHQQRDRQGDHHNSQANH